MAWSRLGAYIELNAVAFVPDSKFHSNEIEEARNLSLIHILDAPVRTACAEAGRTHRRLNGSLIGGADAGQAQSLSLIHILRPGPAQQVRKTVQPFQQMYRERKLK